MWPRGGRYDDPQLARFQNADPTGLASGDPNLYRYVANDPVNRRDPSGNQDETNPDGLQSIPTEDAEVLGAVVSSVITVTEFNALWEKISKRSGWTIEGYSLYWGFKANDYGPWVVINSGKQKYVLHRQYYKFHEEPAPADGHDFFWGMVGRFTVDTSDREAVLEAERIVGELEQEETALWREGAKALYDAVGFVDPTGAADLMSGALSGSEGDLASIGISIFALLPLGDVAKLAKIDRIGKFVDRLISYAKRNQFAQTRARKILSTISQEIDDVLPHLPKPAADTLQKIKGKIDDFLASSGRVAPKGIVLPAVKKAVNSGIQHAGDQAVAKGLVGAAERATAIDELKVISDVISKTGFPVGTIPDPGKIISRADSVLVPFRNGAAVYEVSKNGTARLQTVLSAAEFAAAKAKQGL